MRRRGGTYDPAQRIWLLSGLLIAAAAAGFLLDARDREALVAEPALPWFLLAAGFFATTFAAAEFSLRDLRVTATLGAVPLTLGLLFTPFDGVLAAAVAGTVLALATRRESLSELVLRMAAIAAGAVGAVHVYDAIAGTAAPFDPRGLVAMGAAVSAAAALAAIASYLAERLAEEDDGPAQLALWLAAALVIWVAGAGLGLAAGILMVTEPYLALLLVPSIALIALSYRLYVVQQRERDRLEFLMTLTRAVNEAPRVEDAVLSLLGHLRRRFNVNVAAITLLPAGDSESALVGTQGPSRGERKVSRADAAGGVQINALVGSLNGATRWKLDEKTPVDLAALLGTPLGRTAVVPVAGRTRTVGALVLANTPDRHGSISSKDLRFLDAIGAHAGAALEAGRLEKSFEQLVQLQEQLHHNAYHDALTGLPNRALFSERLSQAVKRQARQPRPLAVMFIDLDDFKAANDTYGHETGDWLLTSIAERLAGSLRDEDSVARLGGDEFAILLEETPAEEVPRIAARLVEALARPYDVGGEQIQLTASVGVALSPGGRSTDELLRNADVAMYRAKAQGKGRHNLYDEDMREKIFRPLQLKRRLEGAIARNELNLHFQPIYDLETRRMSGAEALLRWNDEELGPVSPGEFIPLAEETGLIVPMGRWTLGRACEAARTWQHLAEHPPWVSVNVSAHQLEDRKFPDLVARTLTENGLDPSRLVLEVTESVCLTDDGSAARAFAILQKLGVRIALDDFGSGYSSLGVLQGFPVSILKLDRTFIEPLQSERDTPLLREMLRMAQSLNLLTIGEGIERIEQLERLKELGCRLGQGYMLAKPLEAAGLAALLGAPLAPFEAQPASETAPLAQPAVR